MFSVTSFWLLVVVLLSVEVQGQPAKIHVRNHHNGLITAYWDTFRSSATAIGLSRIADIIPLRDGSMDTNIGHLFEVVESDTFLTLGLIDVRATEQDYHVYYRVRQCGLNDLEGGDSFLLPPTSSISLFNDFKTFITVALPKYKRKQWVEPSPEIAKGRANFESRRLWLNANQPQKTRTFTEVGYDIIDLPEVVWKPIREFWDKNRHKMALENWEQVNHHVNHWQAPSYMLWLPRETQQLLIRTAKIVLEGWIGGEIPLENTALYGIRCYTNNSILLNHVDRSATHVISAIIQVDQRVEEDWLLEVVGHDKKVRELKLLPGQMALYESASVIHGRPKPFKGDYFANLFVHYRPKGNWDLGVL